MNFVPIDGDLGLGWMYVSLHLVYHAFTPPRRIVLLIKGKKAGLNVTVDKLESTISPGNVDRSLTLIAATAISTSALSGRLP